MYNTIKLDVDHWCYQRYLWQEDMSPNQPPKQKVIKILIYGVRSSGNQAEHALREVARLSSSQYPETAEIILKDMYVDDCLSGDSSKKTCYQTFRGDGCNWKQRWIHAQRSRHVR